MDKFRYADENTPIGTQCFLLPSAEGGGKKPCKVTGARKTEYYTALVVALNDGNGEAHIRVHPSALQLAPIATLADGTPVYVGSTIWLKLSSGRVAPMRVLCYDPFNTDIIWSEPLYPEAYREVTRGTAHVSSFFADCPPTHDRSTGLPFLTPSSERPAKKYINLYQSVPLGKKVLPGSVLFDSKEQAERAKHHAPHVGTFVVTPAD